MVFSERDIDLLRLLCWCQYLPPEAACQICPEAEVQLLRSMGLVRQHRTSGALLLTTQGAEWLGGICPGGVPAFSRSYHKSAIQRRLRISRLALTAYRAGVHIFTTSTEELSASPALFFSSITRSRGSNPWGSTRVAALAHLGELLCSIHYVCPGIGKIALTDELTAFNNQTAAFRGLRRVMVFAGESYASVLSELEAVYPHGDTKLIPYGEAYRRLRLPVHLLSCDDTGAIQLQILATPGYRLRLTQAALKSQYVPPPEGAPALDAMFQGLPFVMAADMDLRRIDAALITAQRMGRPQIALAALKGQAESVLFSRYRDTGLARVFVLTRSALAEALGRPPAPHIPSRMQYLTEKGDVVDAASVRADRTARGLAGAQMRERVPPPGADREAAI